MSEPTMETLVQRIDKGEIQIVDNGGDSYKNAVLIKGTKDSMEGIVAEHVHLTRQHGQQHEDWELALQQLIPNDNRFYDVLEIEITKTKERKTYYFDVTEFYTPG